MISSLLQERTHFIYFIAALAFATEAQLGFDLDIERVTENNDIKYNVNYCGTWYRILDDLSDFKAARVLGHATRVWKVRELKDKSIDSTLIGKIRVMKDVWIDQNARSEKEILDDIISKINKVHSVATVDRNLVADYFIEILADVLVKTTNSAGEQKGDCTSTIFQGDLPLHESKALSVSQILKTSGNARVASTLQGSSASASGSPIGSFQNPTKEHKVLHFKPLQFKGCTAKQHRRILYAECGEPLGKILSDHKRFLTSLGNVAKGKRCDLTC